MKEAFTAAAAVFGAMTLLFFGIILGTVVGGVVGWCVTLVFPFVGDTLNSIARTTLTGFELGAVLGFVGSFIRPSIDRESK